VAAGRFTVSIGAAGRPGAPIRLPFRGGERTIVKRDAKFIRVAASNGLIGLIPHSFPPAEHPEKLWGGPPWSAADAPVGLLVPCKMLISLFRMRDEGVPRGPGGPPHEVCGIPDTGEAMWH
jgi:hypothetical protein